MNDTRRNSGSTSRRARVSQIVGVTGLVSVVLGLLFANPHFSRLCQPVLMVTLASPIEALVAIVLGVVARKERAGRVGYSSGIATLVLSFLFWTQMGIPPCGERFSSDRASAIGSLRTINTSEISYASTYNQGYSPDLVSLGPTSGTPSTSTANLIDEVLAGGRKSGYTFTYTAGRRDANGRIISYTVIARPTIYDAENPVHRTSFFTDETGVIRSTDENRSPTVQDRPLGE